MGVLPSTLLALLALQADLSLGQDDSRVFDGGSSSDSSGTSGQGTSSISSGPSSSSSSRSSSGSDSSSSSSSSSSSVSIPIGNAIVIGLFNLFSPPPSSRRTAVSRQTRPRRPPSARRQPATRRFRPKQRRQQQTSRRRFQAVQKLPPRKTRLSTVQQPTSSRKFQPVVKNQIPADSFPLPAMGCSCNGLVTARGQGECKTLWHQDGVPKAFCYTDEGRCGDQQRSPSGRVWSFQACAGKDGSTKNLMSSSPSSIPIGYSYEPNQIRVIQPARSYSDQDWLQEPASYPNLDRMLDTKPAMKAPLTNQDAKTVSRRRTVSPSCSGLRPCRTPGGKCCKPLGYQGRPSCRGVNNC